MKLSKQQSEAIFELISDELNSDSNKKMREAKRKNQKSEQESVEKFKKTEEYKAIELLSKTFKGSDLASYANKYGIEKLAIWMFKPERVSTYYSSYKERHTIELLAIDCKTLAELKQKLNVHYSLKKKLK